MATFEIKNFDYENFYKNFNFDEYYEKPCEEYLKQMFFDKCCQNKNALLNKKNFPAICDRITELKQ